MVSSFDFGNGLAMTELAHGNGECSIPKNGREDLSAKGVLPHSSLNSTLPTVLFITLHPFQISFGKCAMYETQTKIIPIRSLVPNAFDFEIEVEAHPRNAFAVTPLRGTVTSLQRRMTFWRL